MIDDKYFEVIFKNYNLKIQNSCEEGLMYIKSPYQYEQLINKARKEWENLEIEDKLPEEYFNLIKTKEQMKKVFDMACDICDEFIPISFLNIIQKLGIFDFVEKYAFENTKLEKQILAIKVIGKIKKDEYTFKLIDIIYKSNEELVKESARQALIDIGEIAIYEVLKTLREKEKLNGDDFHLLIALIDIDKEKKTDEVFKNLKEFFRKSNDKSIAARCIAEYNDSRAIPFLRGFLKRNLEELKDDDAWEIRTAITLLGGIEDDI